MRMLALTLYLFFMFIYVFTSAVQWRPQPGHCSHPMRLAGVMRNQAPPDKELTLCGGAARAARPPCAAGVRHGIGPHLSNH